MTQDLSKTDELRPGQRLGSIMRASAGNMVECFDWFSYAAFALYFAKVFFPAGDQTAQLLSSAAVYAVGFFFRPLGAWLMGLYGDRVGRRGALIISVWLMCIGSMAIALCPGYATIGIAAPIILVLARILQGISMGGEYGTSATYMSEMAGRRDRGFWSGVFYATLMSGQLLSLALFLVLGHVLSPETMQAWGWRIPFFLGGALALVVFWLRQDMKETPSFLARSKVRVSTWDLVRSHPRQSLMVMGLTAGGTLGYYTFGTYIQKFLANTSGFSKDQASLITAGAMFIFMLAQPIVGGLSDRIGRRPLLITFGIMGAAMTWPVLYALSHTKDVATALILVTFALLVVSLYSAVNAIVKAELFPTEVRALGVSLPYSLANAIFGGTAEFVALAFKQAGHETWFFTYVTVVILGSLFVYLGLPDTRANSQILED